MPIYQTLSLGSLLYKIKKETENAFCDSQIALYCLFNITLYRTPPCHFEVSIQKNCLTFFTHFNINMYDQYKHDHGISGHVWKDGPSSWICSLRLVNNCPAMAQCHPQVQIISRLLVLFIVTVILLWLMIINKHWLISIVVVFQRLHDGDQCHAEDAKRPKQD